MDKIICLVGASGSGRASQVSDTLIEDREDMVTDELYDALSTFFQFDVMQALRNY